MPSNQNRMNRIDEEYRKELSQIISYELKNPNITGLISVTKVKVTNDLKYDINLDEKAVAKLGEIDSNFESCAVGKMLSKIISYYREIVCERKNQSVQQTSFLSYYKKFPQPPQFSAATILIS